MEIILAVLLSCLIVTLVYLYLCKRQVDSICRQLDMHEDPDTTSDIRLDILVGPFGKLRDKLNRIFEARCEERRRHLRIENNWKELVTNVSHDIRTPITSVSGYFTLLMNTDDPEKQKQYADKINARLRFFSDMLENFFDYSKISSEDFKNSPEKLDIKSVLSETLFLYVDEIEGKLGTPKIDFEDAEPSVYADRANVMRVFQNIIKNALVHGSGDLRVSLKSDNKNVIITFRNSTTEELPEDINRVFDRTFIGNDSRSEVKSTGLGLCIVKELMEIMGGSAEAFGNPGVFGIAVTFKKMQ